MVFLDVQSINCCWILAVEHMVHVIATVTNTLYNYLQLADAGSSLGGLAVEGRVRKWGEICHYVLFDAAIAGYNQQCTATLSVQGQTWCM